MGNIFIFRGKSATGKTTISNKLSQKLNIAVLRKDDIYDSLASSNFTHGMLNDICYKSLKKIIQTNIDLNNSLVIDIALHHNPYLIEFLSDINFKSSNVYQFLCICSDNDIWRKRVYERILNPTPNQLFKSVEQAGTILCKERHCADERRNYYRQREKFRFNC